MKTKQKTQQRQKAKIVFKARIGSPFKIEDAQEIGEFIEKCKDKSTRGILEEVKQHPESKIYEYIEWNDKEAGELYRLQRIRNIVNHLTINVISIGDSEPIKLKYDLTAFESVIPSWSDVRVYAPRAEVMSNEDYRRQTIQRAKVELRNWMERYNQLQELAEIINIIREKLD